MPTSSAWMLESTLTTTAHNSSTVADASTFISGIDEPPDNNNTNNNSDVDVGALASAALRQLPQRVHPHTLAAQQPPLQHAWNQVDMSDEEDDVTVGTNNNNTQEEMLFRGDDGHDASVPTATVSAAHSEMRGSSSLMQQQHADDDEEEDEVAARVLQSLMEKDELIAELTKRVEEERATSLRLRVERDAVLQQHHRTKDEVAELHARIEHHQQQRATAEKHMAEMKASILAKDEHIHLLTQDLQHAQQQWELKLTELNAHGHQRAAHAQREQILATTLADVREEKVKDISILREHIASLQRELRRKSRQIKMSDDVHQAELHACAEEVRQLSEHVEDRVLALQQQRDAREELMQLKDEETRLRRDSEEAQLRWWRDVVSYLGNTSREMEEEISTSSPQQQQQQHHDGALLNASGTSNDASSINMSAEMAKESIKLVAEQHRQHIHRVEEECARLRLAHTSALDHQHELQHVADERLAELTNLHVKMMELVHHQQHMAQQLNEMEATVALATQREEEAKHMLAQVREEEERLRVELIQHRDGAARDVSDFLASDAERQRDVEGRVAMCVATTAQLEQAVEVAERSRRAAERRAEMAEAARDEMYLRAQHLSADARRDMVDQQQLTVEMNAAQRERLAELVEQLDAQHAEAERMTKKCAMIEQQHQQSCAEVAQLHGRVEHLTSLNAQLEEHQRVAEEDMLATKEALRASLAARLAMDDEMHTMTTKLQKSKLDVEQQRRQQQSMEQRQQAEWQALASVVQCVQHIMLVAQKHHPRSSGVEMSVEEHNNNNNNSMCTNMEDESLPNNMSSMHPTGITTTSSSSSMVMGNTLRVLQQLLGQLGHISASIKSVQQELSAKKMSVAALLKERATTTTQLTHTPRAASSPKTSMEMANMKAVKDAHRAAIKRIHQQHEEAMTSAEARVRAEMMDEHRHAMKEMRVACEEYVRQHAEVLSSEMMAFVMELPELVRMMGDRALHRVWMMYVSSCSPSSSSPSSHLLDHGDGPSSLVLRASVASPLPSAELLTACDNISKEVLGLHGGWRELLAATTSATATTTTSSSSQPCTLLRCPRWSWSSEQLAEMHASLQRYLCAGEENVGTSSRPPWRSLADYEKKDEGAPRRTRTSSSSPSSSSRSVVLPRPRVLAELLRACTEQSLERGLEVTIDGDTPATSSSLP